MRRALLPFSAVVGQEQMKLALILNAVNPAIGGVLIRGDRGTAKSTAVRALARLLPDIETVEGCRFNCDPAALRSLCWECRARLSAGEDPLPSVVRQMRVVNLPINASEDRVVGSIDLEAAFRYGTKRFEPGVLAEANRNVLYVDEVNLLDDHIVDVLLDAAATGVNVVEREGLSLEHPSRFILVGTMNPAEGELRPQLLDRFGLCIDVTATSDVNERIEIAERDAANLCLSGCSSPFEQADGMLAGRLALGISILRSVELTTADARVIARECVESGVEGHRADVVSARTARAIAAYRGRTSATKRDLYDAMEMALSHRARSPIQRPVDSYDDEARAEDEERGETDPRGQDSDRAQDQHAPDGTDGADTSEPEEDRDTPEGRSDDGIPDARDDRADSGSQVRGGRDPDPEHEFVTKNLELAGLQKPRQKSGRRALSISTDKRGRYVYARTQQRVNDLALDATLRAAAPHQAARGREEGDRVILERRDLRQKVRKRKVGNLIVFAVDASGSMDADERMAVTKGAALSLLQDAYVRRDKVAVIVFNNKAAEIVVPPTGGAALAKKLLAHVAVGGTTPLAHGLLQSYNLIKTQVLRDASLRPLLILISDGHANVPLGEKEPIAESREIAARIKLDGIETLVVDPTVDSTDPDLSNQADEVFMYQNYSRSLCRRLAEELGARHCGLYDLARDLPALVSQRLTDGG